MLACLLRSAFLVMMVASLCALQSSTSYAADEPDLIFKRPTAFKWATPNDKLATYGIDDPEIEGVACHFTVPGRGGLTGWIGVAEEVSDISLACRQVGPQDHIEPVAQGVNGADVIHRVLGRSGRVCGSGKRSAPTRGVKVKSAPPKNISVITFNQP